MISQELFGVFDVVRDDLISWKVYTWSEKMVAVIVYYFDIQKG